MKYHYLSNYEKVKQRIGLKVVEWPKLSLVLSTLVVLEQEICLFRASFTWARPVPSRSLVCVKLNGSLEETIFQNGLC